jgi:pimeloyl-ACP methyl ester carboxylesterase
LVLDGASPPEAIIENAADYAQALDAVFDSCAASAACNHAFPDLKTRFVTTLNELNRSPLRLEDNIIITGDAIVQSLVAFQGDPNTLRYLPAVIDAFAQRDARLLGMLLARGTRDSELLPPDPTFSDALFFSVQCNEAYPFVDRGLVQAQANGGDPIIRAKARDTLQNLAICDAWPSGRGSNLENRPVPLTVPTLVFNGQFDLQTPAHIGRRVATSNSLARAFDFPASGHIALQQSPQRAISIFVDFQRKQNARSIDSSCLTALPQIEWKTAIDQEFLALVTW